MWKNFSHMCWLRSDFSFASHSTCGNQRPEQMLLRNFLNIIRRKPATPKGSDKKRPREFVSPKPEINRFVWFAGFYHFTRLIHICDRMRHYLWGAIGVMCVRVLSDLRGSLANSRKQIRMLVRLPYFLRITLRLFMKVLRILSRRHRHKSENVSVSRAPRYPLETWQFLVCVLRTPTEQIW